LKCSSFQRFSINEATMRLRHIEVFSAIMRTGSAVGASRLLNVTQPSISKLLQHAELRLGFKLFDRSKGKLVPTPEALRLQEELESFDKQLLRIKRLVADLAIGSTSPLRIAATPAIAHHLLPPIIKQWCNAYPASECAMTVSHTKEMVYALLLNEVDMGLTMQPVAHPNLISTPLSTCKYYAIAPKGWWPKKLLSTPLPPEELSNQPMVSIDISSPLGAQIATWLENVAPPPRTRVSVQTFTLARALVEDGLGLSVVDSYTANARLFGSEIQIRELDMPTHIYALTNGSRPPPNTANYILDMLKQ
jgi:DNA-binding transcriptional LysR family regulator